MASELENNNVIRIGERILYVEPNDVYGMVNGIPVTPDYTDMCISFDLEVETVPRTGYVSGEKEVTGTNNQLETYHIWWTSYQANANPENNQVSFMKGTDYLGTSYLTTYYTDINFNDFNKSNVVEGLGVESVNVSFESYYTPTIKIRFIDVRGASLFGREEASHVDEQMTQDSIWGCFFTFPYPKFKLQIKGFYGHPVTYQLTCTDFRANFNSKNGNFEIDVTFLGYDYGILADIPTAYLLAAPYSKYVGEDYWNQHVNSPEWQLSDKNAPQKLFETVREIRKHMRYAETNENGEKTDDGDSGEDFTDKLTQKGELERLESSYNAILDFINKNLDSYYSFTYNDSEYFLFEAKDNNFWMNLCWQTESFYKVLNTFNKNYKYQGFSPKTMIFGREITRNESVGAIKSEIIGGTNTQEENTTVLVRVGNDSTTATSNNEQQTQTETNVLRVVNKYNISSTDNPFGVGTNLTADSKLSFDTQNIKDVFYHKNGVKTEITEGWETLQLGSPKGYQIIPINQTVSKIKTLFNELNAFTAKDERKTTEEQDEVDTYLSRLNIYRAVGLLPTIENVFKTIMCHLETLVAMIYHCKTIIDNQITDKKRTPEKLGVGDFNFSDANNQTVKDVGVPPWVAVSVAEKKNNNDTLFVQDSVNTVGWVGDFHGETEWEEAKLIEGLSLAALHILEENNDAKQYTYASSALLMCLPGDVNEGVFPTPSLRNPYVLGEYLGIRASALFGILSYKQNEAAALGVVDAINFFSAIGKEEAKHQFIDWMDWKNIVKKSPTTSKSETTAHVYTVNPGCESQMAKILTDNNDGKYRYTYTETVVGRTNSNIRGTKRLGMVPIVTGNEKTIMGTETLPATFISNCHGKQYRDVNAVYLKSGNGKVSPVYHRGSSNYFMSLMNKSEYTDKPYENDAMFNIYGGGLHPEGIKFFEKQKQIIDGEKITSGEYEDTDFSWRNSLKSYWTNVGSDNSYYYMKNGVDLEKVRWTIAQGTQTNTSFTNIFYSPFYYAQNENRSINDDLLREGAKCLLFLASCGYDFDKIINTLSKTKSQSSFINQLPYGAILLIGGLIWRSRQAEDCINYPSGYHKFSLNSISLKNSSILSTTDIPSSTKDEKTTKPWIKFQAWVTGDNEYRTIPFNETTLFDINVSNRLVKEFEYFLKNKWRNISVTFERDPKNDNDKVETVLTYYTYDTANQYLTKVTKDDKTRIEKERQYNIKANPTVQLLDNPVIVVNSGWKYQNADNDTDITFDKACWDSYVDSFCAKIEEMVNKTTETTSDTPKGEMSKDTDLKLAMYMYMKRLWDRWFMMSSKEEYTVSNYMKHFVFMDSLYRNIGSVLHVNCEKLQKALSNINGESMLFQLLGTITTDHNCHFFGFPDYFGFGDDNLEQENATVNNLTPTQKIEDMFKPIPFTRKAPLSTSNKYVVMLVYNQSENITDFNGYKNDSFDIFSHDGTDNVLPETFKTQAVDETLLDVPSEERRVRRYGYNIPSFGVAFGRQNNAIFKNINIGMSNPIATEQSINALSIIAEKGGGSEKSICFYGQDLFPVYNGYSYTCTIEMMGDAQIMPLMYFQLLNVPMFRGTYMIYSVTHTMRPGDMTTTFKGMKLSRNALPFAKEWYTNARIFIGNDGTYYGDVLNNNGLWEDEIPTTWDTEHFTLEEMIRSNTANQMKMSNMPSQEHTVNLHNLMKNCLEKIREIYGKEITVSSGYRSPAVNARLIELYKQDPKNRAKPSENSQHMYGQAADIKPTGGKQDMRLLFEAALKFGDFDQLILERAGGGEWVHVSYRKTNRRHNVYFYNSKTATYTNIKNNWQDYF